MSKFYAVVKGMTPGVYKTWKECKKQVNGFPGALFKKFETEKEAKEFILDPSRKRKIPNEPPKSKRRKFEELHVYTDGGCTANGYKNAVAGVGVYFSKDDPRNISKKIEGVQTNNRAELSAIVEALKVCLDELKTVVIFTDSTYSMRGIDGTNKRHKNKDLFKEIDELLKKRKGLTRFRKVKGHSGSKDGNHYADLLATYAIANN